jgi:hypothetical protein
MNEEVERKLYKDWLHQSPEFADTIISAWDVWMGCAALAQPEPAAHPPRTALTDAELERMYNAHASYQEEGPLISGWFDFARAIEAAHGIGKAVTP